jgi:hypothetical protein
VRGVVDAKVGDGAVEALVATARPQHLQRRRLPPAAIAAGRIAGLQGGEQVSGKVDLVTREPGRRQVEPDGDVAVVEPWQDGDVRPFAQADRCDDVRQGCEFVPDLAGSVDDLVVGLGDGVGEPFAAQVPPDVLDRVELGRRDGNQIRVMFLGARSFSLVCQPAWSRSSTM